MTHEMLAMMVMTGSAILRQNYAGCTVCYKNMDHNFLVHFLVQEFYLDSETRALVAQRCPVCGTIR